jgi:hypothetical protein
MQSTTGKKQSEMQSDLQKIADRYEHVVSWSDEDRCYIGKCPELFLASMAMMLRQSLGNCGKQWRKT